MENKMFCNQCQESARNIGCNIAGVCGKSADVANLQDALMYTTTALSEVLIQIRKEGKEVNRTLNEVVSSNLFMCITNANFDEKAIIEQIKKTSYQTKQLVKLLHDTSNLSSSCYWYVQTKEEMLSKTKEIGILACEDEDIRSLRSLIIYGLKGLAAYLKHANTLQFEQEDIHLFLQEALVKCSDDSVSLEEYITLTLQCGKYGVEGMALLDKANTLTYGHPEITKVNIGTRNNPAILISGHDLRDLELLLEQTKGTGVDVYTHSEMLPAHYYPKFKKYEHFVGNYGNAWWQQTKEFESFNGPILLTTNCLVPPKDSYKQRVFTTGSVGFDGCVHIDETTDRNKDFSEIIALAKNCPPPTPIEVGEIVGGFAHNQVMSLADKVVDAIKSGAIKKFVVMAGCDGRMNVREYYSEFAKALPQDSVILTAGCAKYRYNKLNLGDINGIPRVLDAGQCNDSYSLALIALKLKEVFELDDINDLPIVYNIAWYEQKAVIVLLALLYLGVKNIHLGPTLPAFLSKNVTKVLVDNFNIAPITNVEDDIKNLINN